MKQLKSLFLILNHKTNILFIGMKIESISIKGKTAKRQGKESNQTHS